MAILPLCSFYVREIQNTNVFHIPENKTNKYSAREKVHILFVE